mgnify:FL=1
MLSHDLWAVLGGVVASAYALARLSLNQQKMMTDRLTEVLEAAIHRSEARTDALHLSLDDLRAGVRESNSLLSRLTENQGLRTFGGDP